ncbi:hypothetical protein NW759_001777 [Fusarium solani]|nr:hypothetical protein NW759_001777 [Fusarium solani]
MDVNETLTSFTRDDQDSAFAKFQISHPFLIHASSNVFSHAKAFFVLKSKTWSLFDQILTNGHALVRPPWASNSDQELEYLAMMEWACSVAHAPLTLLISSHNDPARDNKKMLRPQVSKLIGMNEIHLSKHVTTGTSELEKNLVRREALFVSAISGQAKFVQKLLSQVMADVCKQDSSAFNIAALTGDIGITGQFLDACVACKGARQCLEPALFAVAQGGSFEVVQLFIDKVNSLSAYSWQRAQMTASSYHHGQIVEMLTKAGVTRTISPRR